MIEKVKKGLECCILHDPDDKPRCDDCPYDGKCGNRLKIDALMILKEQQEMIDIQGKILDARKALINELMRIRKIEELIAGMKAVDAVKPCVTASYLGREGVETRWYACGECSNPIEPGDAYCRHCGRKVLWDDN